MMNSLELIITLVLKALQHIILLSIFIPKMGYLFLYAWTRASTFSKALCSQVKMKINLNIQAIDIALIFKGLVLPA